MGYQILHRQQPSIRRPRMYSDLIDVTVGKHQSFLHFIHSMSRLRPSRRIKTDLLPHTDLPDRPHQVKTLHLACRPMVRRMFHHMERTNSSFARGTTTRGLLKKILVQAFPLVATKGNILGLLILDLACASRGLRRMLT